ncbi:MAG TPA: hypothetical protein VJ770_23180 [Stellaceae bacterium]|nr:hypothetical protein [Stellaceae bacterium]
MPELILTPPTFTEGDTIEAVLHGKEVSIFWRDENTLVINGDERPILLTEWNSESIGFAFAAPDEDFSLWRDEDPDQITAALADEFADLRKRAAAARAARIEHAVDAVEQQMSNELGRPLSTAERDYVRTLVRERVLSKTSTY